MVQSKSALYFGLIPYLKKFGIRIYGLPAFPFPNNPQYIPLCLCRYSSGIHRSNRVFFGKLSFYLSRRSPSKQRLPDTAADCCPSDCTPFFFIYTKASGTITDTSSSAPPPQKNFVTAKPLCFTWRTCFCLSLLVSLSFL